LDDVVFSLDSKAYYNNNKTLVAENPDEGWFHIVLNFTGMLGGSIAQVPVDCYVFIQSVRTRESLRWDQFGNSWGNFFLAFLFNQMGNALTFQQKFANIAIDRET
jgi:hypothetical protein